MKNFLYFRIYFPFFLVLPCFIPYIAQEKTSKDEEEEQTQTMPTISYEVLLRRNL